MKRAYLTGLVVTFAALSASAADDPRRREPDTVTVIGDRNGDPAEATEDTEKLLKIPGSFGDPLQAIYNLPGVVQTLEVGGAPAVRGSSPDENAFLIDFLPASYVFHDFGFSIFNENLIRDFGLKTAGFGSRYGKATGAIFDVALREPRQQPWSYTVDASFLRIGALAEGQLSDNQAMYVSVRESVVHLLLKLRADAIEDEEDIRFKQYPRARDFQAKYSWQLNEANRISVLGVGAQDQTELDFGSESDFALIDPGVAGNARLKTAFGSGGLNWTYADGSNRLRTAVGYLDESRELSSGSGAEFSNTYTDRWTAKSHYDRVLGPHQLGVGGEWQRANYDYDVRLRYRSCTNFTPECRVERGPLITANQKIAIDSIEGFAEDTWQLFDPLSITLGAHYTSNDYLDESFVEPRVASSLRINTIWELHASWGEYHQLPKIGQIVPIFGNPDLESTAATHTVLGVNYRGMEHWSWTTDVYYKRLRDLVVDVTTGEQYLNRATGRAYGAELMIRKEEDRTLFQGTGRSKLRWFERASDRIYGWLALSVAKSERHNELTGVDSRFEYDTPVIANLVIDYRINRNWDAGLRWMLRSGLPYTPIVANKPNPNFPGFYLPVYGELNSARASPFHRLDLRAERRLQFGRIHGSAYIDIINAYARKNGGAVQYKPKPGTSEYELEEAESLPLLPSIGIKLTF